MGRRRIGVVKIVVFPLVSLPPVPVICQGEALSTGSRISLLSNISSTPNWLSMRKERRKHPRAQSVLAAKIQKHSRPFAGIIRNVSPNWAFVCCDHRRLPGEYVRIAIELTDCLPLAIEAEAVYSRILSREETGDLYGVSFRFLNVCLMQSKTSLI